MKFLPGFPIRLLQSVNKQTQKKTGENSHKGRRTTNFRKTCFQKTKIHMTAKLQALEVLVLICFQRILNSGNIKTLPQRETLRPEGIRGNSVQSMKTDSGKGYLTFCISAVFWSIRLAQFLSRTERKWKAVAEVVQMKQRERDFLPGKLYLLRVYTNYLLTFDQQLLEHLFQVLQEKKIIFKSADKAWLSHIFLIMY